MTTAQTVVTKAHTILATAQARAQQAVALGWGRLQAQRARATARAFDWWEKVYVFDEIRGRVWTARVPVEVLSARFQDVGRWVPDPFNWTLHGSLMAVGGFIAFWVVVIGLYVAQVPLVVGVLLGFIAAGATAAAWWKLATRNPLAPIWTVARYEQEDGMVAYVPIGHSRRYTGPGAPLAEWYDPPKPDADQPAPPGQPAVYRAASLFEALRSPDFPHWFRGGLSPWQKVEVISLGVIAVGMAGILFFLVMALQTPAGAIPTPPG